MAVKVKDLLELSSLQGMKLLAGEKGLDRVVCSAGIADYEFAPDIAYCSENAFEKDSFVISSLLFAQNDKQRILPAVKALYAFGTSAFAFKRIIFDSLPREVIDFAEEKQYPLFTFGEEFYFENIIYEIMDAVQRDDTQILAEEKIKKMIDNELSADEVNRISKSVSLLFRRCAMAVYIQPRFPEKQMDTGRIFRNFYMNKRLKHKSLLCRYNRGLFLILTSPYDEEEKFALILEEIVNALGLDASAQSFSRSGIHPPHEELDRCFRESYHTYMASAAEGRDYASYDQIGMFRYLIPQKDDVALREFSDAIMEPLLNKEELLRTGIDFVLHGGDVHQTACACSCHDNTIRYRLAKVKELTGAAGKTEAEFYAELSAAVRIYLLRKGTESRF